VKDLLKTSDLSAADLHTLLDLAADFKANPLKAHGLLTGKTAVLYFAKPSTRTRLSFETAVVQLGGVPLSVSTQDLQVGRGETLEDTAKIVSRYAKAFVVRTFADDDLQLMAQAASIPVINALTDNHHPCQSLADLLTLKEHWGTFEGKTLAYVGCGNNVLHSLMEAAALAGLSMTVATPAGYGPDPDIAAGAQALAAAHGGSITFTHDPHKAVYGADAVYTDAWVSMGDKEEGRAAQIAALTPYRVTDALLDYALPDALFMHGLPAHRGHEVTADVLDGPQSVVFDQAENRLHTGQAVLYALLNGLLTGVAGVAEAAHVPATLQTAAVA
jgi:ornithine carbamoyltransferase